MARRYDLRTARLGVDLAEAVLAEKVDGLDRSGYTLGLARELLTNAEPDNRTLLAAEASLPRAGEPVTGG